MSDPPVDMNCEAAPTEIKTPFDPVTFVAPSVVSTKVHLILSFLQHPM